MGEEVDGGFASEPALDLVATCLRDIEELLQGSLSTRRSQCLHYRIRATLDGTGLTCTELVTGEVNVGVCSDWLSES